MKHALCCKASNLGIETMPCFAYCLGDFELAFLVVPNAANSDFPAKIPKHAVIGLADDSLERFDLVTQLFMDGSSSIDLRRQRVELPSDVFQFLQNAGFAELGRILEET